jgi:hypothetical protein
MSYLHIPNLYKSQEILLFKQCFAMEKIDGTSGHLCWSAAKNENIDRKGNLRFFSGGSDYERFVELFNAEELREKIEAKCVPSPCYIYGEVYGGKMQGMKKVYGEKLKFVVFEVKLGDSWLSVPDAEDVSKSLGLEFVYYKLIPATIEAIDAERDALSEQAKRNMMGDHPREGIVLRPLIEVTMNNGERIIVKHKTEACRETATSRPVSPESIKILSDAKAIATEWVTRERLHHIFGHEKIECAVENISKIIPIMIEDILREGSGEIIDSPKARREIGRLTAFYIKEMQKEVDNHGE